MNPEKLIPVEEAALVYIKSQKVEQRMFQLPQFSKFKHIFYRLDPDFFTKVNEGEDGADEMSEKIENYYWQCLKKLVNQDHNLDVSYNLLLTQNFLIIVLRQVEAVKEVESPENLEVKPNLMTVTLNSLGFAGTLAVKREEDLKLIQKYSPLGILERVSVPVE